MLVKDFLCQIDDVEDHKTVASVYYMTTGDGQYLNVNDSYEEHGIIKVGLSATLTWPEGYVINDVEKMLEELGVKDSLYDYDQREDNQIWVLCASWNWCTDYATSDDFYLNQVDDLKGFEGNIFDNVTVTYTAEMDIFND